MSRHSELTDSDIHALTAISYVDIAARDADSNFQVLGNVNKVVHVNSPINFYILSSISPTVWAVFGFVSPLNFISSQDVSTQTVAIVNTYQPITFGTNDLINGWAHTPGSDSFICPETDIYNLNIFMHIVKTMGSSALLQFRATINGVPTGSVFVEDLVTNNETKFFSASTILFLDKDDIIIVEFTANSINVELHSPTITGPGIAPSIVMSINRVL